MALPQGSPLSPVCFNAYTLPLATMPVPPNVTIYTLADDILLLGTGGYFPAVVTQMQEVLNAVHLVCQEASMKINPTKAAACVLSLSKAPLPTPQLQYDGQLGTLKTAQRKGLNQQRMLTLYRSLILSRLTYGGEVVAACPTTLEKLDRVQTAALRIITGCTRDTSRVALRYMLDVPLSARKTSNAASVRRLKGWRRSIPPSVRRRPITNAQGSSPPARQTWLGTPSL